MIANALGRCEFRTYRNHEEVREGEYYMWNYSPNVNENSTMFLHKLIAKLYMHNEALIVETLPAEAHGRTRCCRQLGHPGSVAEQAERI